MSRKRSKHGTLFGTDVLVNLEVVKKRGIKIPTAQEAKKKKQKPKKKPTTKTKTINST